MPKVELLAPAGSYESLVAALAAGADAAYIGGNRFGARAYADNLDQEQMLRAIDYTHLHGAKLYLTVNTLIKEKEMNELYDYLYPFYLQGIDAVIVQDFGALSFIKQHFPELPIHASTQMTITGYHGAKKLKELGAERIVTARELSLKEIANIHQHVDIEIESFIHGALCYGYSGQCLMSSLIGGRSGNRGRCAQPCRLAYEVKRDGKILNAADQQHVLSLKDLYTLEILPDLIDAGIYSLKIEGRMKSPRYTAGVVSIYRKYLDLYLKSGRSSYQVDQQDQQLLLDLFDRGGLTNGFFHQHADRNMLALKEKPSFRKGNEELFQYLDNTYLLANQQLAISGRAEFEENKPARLILTKDNCQVNIFGAVPQQALKQPIKEEQIRKQLLKTGHAPFFFDHLEIFVSGDLFIPVQELNELRRKGMAELEQAYLKQFYPQTLSRAEAVEETVLKSIEALLLNVSLEQKQGLELLLKFPEVAAIYIDSTGFEPHEWESSVALCHQAGKKCLLILPHVFRTQAERYFIKHLERLKQAGFDGVLIRTLEEVDFVNEYQLNLPMMFDYTMYVFNKLTKEVMLEQGACRLTLPLELNSREIEGLDGSGMELLAYGHLPMMVSASCLTKTVEGCQKTPGILRLKDRKGKEMLVKNHCQFCYNTIYNSSALTLIGQEALVARLNPASIRLSFTTETPLQIEAVVNDFIDAFIYHQKIELKLKEFTRGHFKRGIE